MNREIVNPDTYLGQGEMPLGRAVRGHKPMVYTEKGEDGKNYMCFYPNAESERARLKYELDDDDGLKLSRLVRRHNGDHDTYNGAIRSFDNQAIKKARIAVDQSNRELPDELREWHQH